MGIPSLQAGIIKPLFGTRIIDLVFQALKLGYQTAHRSISL
jgi:hypothetical protein